MTDRVMRFKEQLATGRAPIWTEEVADGYDGISPRGDEDATVAFLADLAHGGPILELAVGTGRIAVPLAAQGIEVDGIDNSPAMVAKLRAKPGGEAISVTIGDYADVGVERTYRLIYLVFNTIGNLITQDNQIRCFENVAAHLTDDGVFVVEQGSPAWLYRLPGNQYVETEAVDVGYVALDTARHDPLTQTLHESHVVLTRDRVRLYPILTRYIWPSEMDLMARIAGLRLHERWGGWSREPYTATSTNCVAVYGR